MEIVEKNRKGKNGECKKIYRGIMGGRKWKKYIRKNRDGTTKVDNEKKMMNKNKIRKKYSKS